MDYQSLNRQLFSLMDGIPYVTTNLSNAAAFIFDALDRLNWAGFYLFDQEKNLLYLSSFQGKPACTMIPMGKGVCGTAAKRDATIVVSDVHQFPGHIACDSASNSEIVIPIHVNQALYGVLDIDSPVFNRFSEEDREGLELLVSTIEKVIK